MPGYWPVFPPLCADALPAHHRSSDSAYSSSWHRVRRRCTQRSRSAPRRNQGQDRCHNIHSLVVVPAFRTFPLWLALYGGQQVWYRKIGLNDISHRISFSPVSAPLFCNVILMANGEARGTAATTSDNILYHFSLCSALFLKPRRKEKSHAFAQPWKQKTPPKRGFKHLPLAVFTAKSNVRLRKRYPQTGLSGHFQWWTQLSGLQPGSWSHCPG